MSPARIAELLAPFLASPEDQRPGSQDLGPSISTYIDILLRWNARVNLTAIRDPEEIVTRHFGESLFAARHLFPNEHVGGPYRLADGPYRSSGGPPKPEFSLSGDTKTDASATSAKEHRGRAALQRREKLAKEGALAPVLADIGSGAGFPGIPIKLWAPDLHVTLIESNHKKATFLREVTRALTLTNINIQNTRAETLPPASFDVVTLRAVERFESILPVAARLVAPHGRLALLVGSSQLEQARQLEPSLSWQEPVSIPGSHSRAVVIAQRNHDDMNQHEQ